MTPKTALTKAGIYRCGLLRLWADSRGRFIGTPSSLASSLGTEAAREGADIVLAFCGQTAA